MKSLFVLVFTSLFICQGTNAKDMSVEINALKDLDAQTQLVEVVSTYSGKEIIALVASVPGQAYVLKSPLNIQQIEYLKGNGEVFEKGEAFAIIKGPEIHHFYMAYQTKKNLFEQANKHYANSKMLYERKSLSEQAWLKISNDYYNTKMELDELTHFFELALNFDEKNDALTLGSPIAGVLQHRFLSVLDIESVIASFAPLQSIRLKINLPIKQALPVSSFRYKSCQVDVDYTEAANSAFYQTVWTQSLPTQCDFVIGQELSALPVYRLDAYKVKQSSVFTLEGANYIFVVNQNKYQAIEVTLITSQSENYIVQSAISLANKTVLISSVSALQGILQGLGL